MKFPESGNILSGPGKSGIGKPEIAIPRRWHYQARVLLLFALHAAWARGPIIYEPPRPRPQSTERKSERAIVRKKVLRGKNWRGLAARPPHNKSAKKEKAEWLCNSWALFTDIGLPLHNGKKTGKVGSRDKPWIKRKKER